jgi:adenylate cyclase
MSLALYGIYQAQTARQVAYTYLGRRTGARVLSGEMARGASARIEATIAFVDVRGFTRLSSELAVDRVVELLNASFEVVDRHAQIAGGEILKFMGDAALIVFPHDAADVAPCFDILEAMAAMADEVHERTESLGRPIRVGVGLHAGQVMYGNVGANGRHDFTVLGPAVNLASRLETLSKQLDATIVVSQAFVERCSVTCPSLAFAEARLGGTIMEHGDQHVAGIDEPLVVWSFRRS